MSDSEDIQISISDTDSEVEQQSTSSISEFDTEEDDMSISSSDSDFDEELEEPVTKRAKKGGTKKKDVQVEQRQPAADKKTAKAVCKTTPKDTSLVKNNMMHTSDLILKPRDGVSPPAVRKKPVLDTVLQPSEGPKVFKPFPTVQDPKNAFLSVEDQERRQANIEAMLSGDLTVKRHPLLPSILSVSQDTEILKRPFRSPFPNAPAVSDELRRALAARRQFIPFGSGKKFVPPKMIAPATVVQPVEKEIGLPEGVEELILWKSSDGTEQVKVDNSLTRFLRPHQREGVQFLFECVTGLREHDGYGSILADDMGLGKTLQGITLLWTLLNSGHDDLGGKPIAKRIVICCPCALVTNWENECVKWLNGRVRTLAICDSSRDEVSESLKKFTSPSNTVQVLIISYETFRIHAARFQASDTCDLLICDEAHRLKNDQTLTNKALASMHCKRRILLSGTPMQNQLQEFYSMVDFCNPGVLGTPSEFRRTYERPILAGREPDATDEERKLSKERSDQLSTFVNSFILRRTNELLSKHLPPKVIQLVCCKMTPMQLDLYSHFVHSRKVTSLLTKVSGQVLSAITTVRKLMNHPKLIYDLVTESKKNGRSATTGFESCKDLLQPSMFESVRGALPKGWEEFSGKFAVAARMLNLLRRNTKDRVVIVSNFTQTLDLFTQLCRENKYPFVRLDGSISITKREKMVKKFNDPKEDQFIFLLSSKAGGCGLNLIGGNRLIMFDMSWNPAGMCYFNDDELVYVVVLAAYQVKLMIFVQMTNKLLLESGEMVNRRGFMFTSL